jgi:hypothetical protein
MKVKLALLTLAAFLFAFGGNVFAEPEVITGKLRTVDSGGEKIEINNVTDTRWVSYDKETKWPEGITNPMLIVGKAVIVTIDKGRAIQVEKD